MGVLGWVFRIDSLIERLLELHSGLTSTGNPERRLRVRPARITEAAPNRSRPYRMQQNHSNAEPGAPR